jgi:hypothetical protein
MSDPENPLVDPKDLQRPPEVDNDPDPAAVALGVDIDIPAISRIAGNVNDMGEEALALLTMCRYFVREKNLERVVSGWICSWVSRYCTKMSVVKPELFNSPTMLGKRLTRAGKPCGFVAGEHLGNRTTYVAVPMNDEDCMTLDEATQIIENIKVETRGGQTHADYRE